MSCHKQLFILILSLLVVAVTPPSTAQTIADSMAEWSTSGTQGQNGWSNGYYNLTRDGDRSYDTDDFIPFSRAQHWTGSRWDLLAASAGPWTEIGRESTHPNGTNSTPGEEHWTVRRWVSDHSGNVAITWHMRKTNLNGNGVGGQLFIDGAKVDSATIGGADGAGVTETDDRSEPLCLQSADVDANGRLDLTDPLFLLGYLFRNGPPPPAPFASCGPEDTRGDLSCELYPLCL